MASKISVSLGTCAASANLAAEMGKNFPPKRLILPVNSFSTSCAKISPEMPDWLIDSV
jgi:Ni,Fe-hydrogenase III small subunit